MKVLIVEDEPEMLQMIRTSLEEHSYSTETADNFDDALLKVGVYDYDLVILDINLPGGNGLVLLEKLKEKRKSDGVLIVSARNSLDDKLKGLNLGADDYMTKPFHMAELISRVNSILRRRKFDGNNSVSYGNLHFYPEERTANVDGKPLNLHRKEFDILLYLLVNKDKLVTKTALAEHVWGDFIDQADDFEFIYSQIKNIRKKLKTFGASVTIKANYGVGYKLILL